MYTTITYIGPKVCEYYLHWAIWIPRVNPKPIYHLASPPAKHVIGRVRVRTRTIALEKGGEVEHYAPPIRESLNMRPLYPSGPHDTFDFLRKSHVTSNRLSRDAAVPKSSTWSKNYIFSLVRPSFYPLLGPKYPLLGTIYPNLRVQGGSWWLELPKRIYVILLHAASRKVLRWNALLY